MHTSYKRYWEPSTSQQLSSSLTVGTLATTLTYPLEFVKTRIQIKSEGIGIRQYSLAGGYNPHKAFRDIHQSGVGMKGFFHGVDSALTARMSYLFVRNFIYKAIYDKTKPFKPTNDLTYREKGTIGAFAGAIAAIVSNPFEVINIRQIQDGAVAEHRRFNYSSMLDGYGKLVAAEGTAGLMRGLVPNVAKAICLNISLTYPYDTLLEKQQIAFGEVGFSRPIAILGASLFATAVTLPVDHIKTRLQKQHLNPELNRIHYYGFRDCIQKIFLIEGQTGFIPGFYAFYYKTLTYAFLTVYTMDIFTNKWKREAGLKEWQI